MPDTGPVISAENLFLDHAGVNGVFKWLSEKSNRAVLKLVVMCDCNNQTLKNLGQHNKHNFHPTKYFSAKERQATGENKR